MSGPTDSVPALSKLQQRIGPQRMVTFSCLSGLVAMALMCWSIFDPTPFPVMVAMSVGQAIGTLSLLSYLLAILLHARQEKQRPDTSAPP